MFDNSGLWTDDRTTTTENQALVWMPLNPETTTAYYNTRFIMSAKNIKQPIEWRVSKVETEIPTGINKLTLYQDEFKPDKALYDEEHGWWYANYYDSNIDTQPEPELEPITRDYCKLFYNNNAEIKVNGGYKKITAVYYDEFDKETTGHNVGEWKFELQYKDAITDATTLVDVVSDPSNANVIKVKFLGDETYLGKQLIISCKDENGKCLSSINLDILSL